MSNDIVTQGTTAVAFPANLAALFGGKSNLVQHDTTPSVSFKGKVWQINKDGANRQLLDADGNPLPMIEVVVLNANPRRSRTFYEGKFVDGETKSPDCHSYDGKRPANEIETPQATSCESCPQSVKGSKLNDKGHPITACSLRQRIVVVPSDKPTFDALLINMASTSAYDKDSPDAVKGWFAWDSYKTELTKNGVPHTAAVKTKIRFAPDDAYPRLQFKFAGILDEDAINTVLPRIESDEVMSLLNKDHGKGDPEVKQIAAPKPAPVAPAAEPEPIKETPKPPKPKPKAVPKAEVAPDPVKEASKATPVVVDTEEELANALSEWD